MALPHPYKGESMTRLCENDLAGQADDWGAYAARLRQTVGCGLEEVCALALELPPATVRRALAAVRVGVVPVSSGEGCIPGFAELLAATARALGSAAVVLPPDDEGFAQARAGACDVLLWADDDTYLAEHVRSGHSAENGWATGRGAIWVDVWYCFRQGTPLQILFGRGPGTVHTALAQMEESLPYHLTDTIGAHNEYLELLLTTGIAGLVAWGIFLGIALRAAGALLPREHQKRGWLFCVVAYLVQALFNNRVAAVFPVFMVLLGVLTSAPEETAARQKTGGLLLAALLLTAAGTLAGNALLHYLFI